MVTLKGLKVLSNFWRAFPIDHRHGRPRLPVSGLRPHHLRSQESRGSIAPLQVLIAANDDFGAAKIAESDRASSTHQDILRLQIPMHYLVVMQIIQGLDNQG